MSIQHIILTRFNIATPGREVAIRNSPGWLERRFDLFERYCLPSVAAQEGADFTWLIYFDRDTPELFRARIKAAQVTVPFEARFVGVTQMSEVADDVRERLARDCIRVITTRLDNDDAIAGQFFAAIQEAARAQRQDAVLNFPHGLAVQDGRLYSAFDASNPFTSLVEGAAHPRTIWSVQHHLLGREFRLQQIISAPQWLQVVHGDNVINRIKGKRLADGTALLQFPVKVEPPITQTSPFVLALDRGALHPLRRLRELAIRLVKPLIALFRKSKGQL